MFTGIIEEKANVLKMNKTSDTMVLTLKAKDIISGIALGDSISVNGVCLTVTSFDEESFTVDVMPETMTATSLKKLKEGAAVNVERAMPADGRFGGHFVSGHVDALGTISSMVPYENAYYVDITVPENLMPYMMLKGSVAVDGISLTIFGVDDNSHSFTISLIPHTWEETIISEKAPGDPVNIETDMLIKYTDRLLNTRYHSSAEGINEQKLKENGFM
ncbi:riboflavin synthase [Salibacterium salarium]|uniref:Riboflavin synthase n=1 Tax=Salibacterium salarium TaxID=284579 RepID=A0A428N8A1_9BACI|nr:riboflavin synthase [Salibacterium salarium]RSL34622.1 riboflavin synthase [Salibacterium salarium]